MAVEKWRGRGTRVRPTREVGEEVRRRREFGQLEKRKNRRRASWKSAGADPKFKIVYFFLETKNKGK
jgi:hypothetical protein